MFRKPIPIIAAAFAAAACIATIASMAVAATKAPAPSAPQAVSAGGGGALIQLRQTGLGRVLVNGRGFTLYAFGRDGVRKDRCVTISGCPDTWPILQTDARPRAGAGIKRSRLGTIKVRGGITQVTYAGHPLYGYVGDTSPGSTGYVGVSAFGGVWSAVKASGALVR
jgi:predicted lipoprotein with Yx(FWY)xxD motif